MDTEGVFHLISQKAKSNSYIDTHVNSHPSDDVCRLLPPEKGEIDKILKTYILQYYKQV